MEAEFVGGDGLYLHYTAIRIDEGSHKVPILVGMADKIDGVWILFVVEVATGSDSRRILKFLMLTGRPLVLYDVG